MKTSPYSIACMLNWGVGPVMVKENLDISNLFYCNNWAPSEEFGPPPYGNNICTWIIFHLDYPNIFSA